MQITPESLFWLTFIGCLAISAICFYFAFRPERGPCRRYVINSVDDTQFQHFMEARRRAVSELVSDIQTPPIHTETSEKPCMTTTTQPDPTNYRQS